MSLTGKASKLSSFGLVCFFLIGVLSLKSAQTSAGPIAGTACCVGACTVEVWGFPIGIAGCVPLCVATGGASLPFTPGACVPAFLAPIP